MAILFARIIAREEYVQPSYRNKKHSSAKDVSSREGSYADAVNRVRRIKIDRFNQWKCGQVVMLGVQRGALI